MNSVLYCPVAVRTCVLNGIAYFPDHRTLPFCLNVCLQLLVVSDLFTERSQFEMMYLTLTELRRVHPSEDEILLQYLVPATCKAAAVLGMVSAGRGQMLWGPWQPWRPELPQQV